MVRMFLAITLIWLLVWIRLFLIAFARLFVSKRVSMIVLTGVPCPQGHLHCLEAAGSERPLLCCLEDAGARNIRVDTGTALEVLYRVVSVL